MCFQLLKLGFPRITIRDKEKKQYFLAFKIYQNTANTGPMEELIALTLLEAMHKRLAYMKSLNIVTVSEYSKLRGESFINNLNKEKRQTIAAFREKGIWKIGLA